ncbi:MAG: radical SAM family heme chaperone HemW [Bacillota bacterium]
MKGEGQSAAVGLYVHIPFCLGKCAYCDFVSYPYETRAAIAYTYALEQEIRLRGKECDNQSVLKSIYLGGGTPTCLPPAMLKRILALIRKQFSVSPEAEITVEANPGTVTVELLDNLLGAGVNRLSIGMQSTEDRLLRVLGRRHTAADAVRAVETARAAGFTNINVDLIFGIPGQSMNDWGKSLSAAVALGVEHVSAYGLEIYAETPLGRAVAAGEVSVCPEETFREMYFHAVDYLNASGYVQYEISNFARPGRESRHNLIYWQGEPYLGLGPAAHSYLNRRRWVNAAELGTYSRALSAGRFPVAEEMYLTRADEIAEAMFLGLRLTEGVSASRFRARFGLEPEAVYGPEISMLIARGLLRYEKDRLRLTREAFPVANQVFVAFV